MKVIHTADLHLGFLTFREENYERFKPLSFAIDYSISHNAQLFIIAGDLFEARDPSSSLEMGFAKEVKRLTQAGIEVLIVTGNHDGPPNPERNIHLDVYRMLEVEGVRISKKMEYIRIGDLNILTIPYPFKRNLLAKEEFREKSEAEAGIIMNQKIIEGLNQILPEIDKTLPAILVAHLPLSEGVVGEEAYSSFTVDTPISVEEIDRKEFSYIALGHFHKRQILTSKKFGHPFVYAGSIDRINFGEEMDDKGFYDIDIDESSKSISFSFVKNPYLRNFLTINLKNESALENIDFDKVKESIVRVIVSGDFSDEKKLKNIIEKVSNVALAFTGIEDRRTMYEQAFKSTFKVTISPQEAIERYLDSKDDPFIKEKKEEILRRAIEILSNVEKKEQ